MTSSQRAWRIQSVCHLYVGPVYMWLWFLFLCLWWIAVGWWHKSSVMGEEMNVSSLLPIKNSPICACLLGSDQRSAVSSSRFPAGAVIGPPYTLVWYGPLLTARCSRDLACSHSRATAGFRKEEVNLQSATLSGPLRCFFLLQLEGTEQLLNSVMILPPCFPPFLENHRKTTAFMSICHKFTSHGQ